MATLKRTWLSIALVGVMLLPSLLAIATGPVDIGLDNSTLAFCGPMPGEGNVDAASIESYEDQMDESKWDNVERILEGKGLESVKVYVVTTNVGELAELLEGHDYKGLLGTGKSTSPISIPLLEIPAYILPEIALLNSVINIFEYLSPTISTNFVDAPDPEPTAFGTIQPEPAMSIVTDHQGIDAAWGLGYTGTDIPVAVVDTGIDFSNPSLEGTYAVDDMIISVVDDTIISSASGNANDTAFIGSSIEEVPDDKVVDNATGGEQNLLPLAHKNLIDGTFTCKVKDLNLTETIFTSANYTIDPVLGFITLTVPLNVGETLICSYDYYKVERTLVDGSLTMKLNNESFADWTYNSSSGEVTLTSLLPVGGILNATYDYYSPYYGWPVAFDPSSMLRYLQTYDTINTWYANTSISGPGPYFESTHTIEMDGLNDFGTQEKVGDDPADDINWLLEANESMSGWDYDLSDLYVTSDSDNWYIGFGTNDGQIDRTFGIYIDNDGAASGATTDPHGNYVDTVSSHNGVVGAAAYSPDGTMVASMSNGLDSENDNTLKIWNLDGDIQKDIYVPGNPINSMVWSPDNNKVALGASDFVKIYDITTGDLVKHFKEAPNFLSFSPDSKNITVAQNGKYKSYDPITGISSTGTFTVSGDPRCGAHNPSNGSQIAMGLGDGSVDIMDTGTGVLIQSLSLPVYTNAISSLAWSPDGLNIITGSEAGVVCVWDAESGSELKNFTLYSPDTGPTNIMSVAWSPSGDYIAAGTSNNTMMVWDTTPGYVEQCNQTNRGEIWSVGFSDTDSVVTGSTDTTVRTWDVDGTSTGVFLAHLPDYAIYINYTYIAWEVLDDGIVQSRNDTFDEGDLFAWDGAAWTVQNFTTIGAEQEYRSFPRTSGPITDYGFLELAIPKEALGNPDEISLEVFSVHKDNATHAHDTTPADVNVDFGSIDWSTEPTSLSNFAKRKIYNLEVNTADFPTLSNRYHFGNHPDENIQRLYGGAGILLSDPNTAGVYDTVCMDLNNDFMFDRFDSNTVTDEAYEYVKASNESHAYALSWPSDTTFNLDESDINELSVILYYKDATGAWMLMNETSTPTNITTDNYNYTIADDGVITLSGWNILVGDSIHAFYDYGFWFYNNTFNITHRDFINESLSHYIHDTITLNYWSSDTGNIMMTNSSTPANIPYGYYNYTVDLVQNKIILSGWSLTEGEIIKISYNWDKFSYGIDNPLSGIDLYGNDGLTDISGGLIYFISDGETPIPYSDTYTTRNGIEDNGFTENIVPENGNLMCLMGEFNYDDVENTGESHGTMTASAIASKGALTNAAGNNIKGVAPNAKIIPVGNIRDNANVFDAWFFSVEGYDGKPGTGDEALIINNGFTYPTYKEDGWDDYSRLAEYIVHTYAKGNVTFIASSGDYGYGYGTTSSPGSAPGLISVGAVSDYSYKSASYGNTVDNEGPNPQYGDVMPLSGRGPTPAGMLKPDVLAIGVGAVDSPLWTNYGLVPDGSTAYTAEPWMSTDLSCAVTSGVMALIYDAYYAVNNVYPSADMARSILMSGCDDALNDVFVQGAGTVNAYRSVQIAAEVGGLLATPSSWIPGDFDDRAYESFTRLMSPGESASQNFTIENTGGQPAGVIKDMEFQKIGEYSFDTFLVSTSSEEWVNILDHIPPTTTMVKVSAYSHWSFFREMEKGMDLSTDYNLGIYDWEDINSDGIRADTEVNLMAECENKANVLETRVYNPLQRATEGLWVRIDPKVPTGDFKTGTSNIPWDVKCEFYNRTDWGWTELSQSTFNAPTDGSDTFTATMNVPEDAEIGTYEGAIYIMNDPVDISNEEIFNYATTNVPDEFLANAPITSVLNEVVTNTTPTNAQLDDAPITGSPELRTEGSATIDAGNETVYITVPADDGLEVIFYTDFAPLLDLSLYCWIPGDGWYAFEEGADYQVDYLTGEIETLFGGVEPGWEFYAYYNYTEFSITELTEGPDYTLDYDNGDVVLAPANALNPGILLYANYSWYVAPPATTTLDNTLVHTETLYLNGTVFTDYTIDLETGLITFTPGLGPGDVVNASYEWYEPQLQNVFVLENDNVLPGYTINVNGAPVTNYEFDTLSGALVFDAPIGPGSLVTADYTHYAHTLTIPTMVNIPADKADFTFGGDTVFNVENELVTDVSTNQVTNEELADIVITNHNEEFVATTTSYEVIGELVYDNAPIQVTGEFLMHSVGGETETPIVEHKGSSESIVAGTGVVYEDGIIMGIGDYNSDLFNSTGIVVFTTPLAAGVSITVDYQYYNSLFFKKQLNHGEMGSGEIVSSTHTAYVNGAPIVNNGSVEGGNNYSISETGFLTLPLVSDYYPLPLGDVLTVDYMYYKEVRNATLDFGSAVSLVDDAVVLDSYTVYNGTSIQNTNVLMEYVVTNAFGNEKVANLKNDWVVPGSYELGNYTNSIFTPLINGTDYKFNTTENGKLEFLGNYNPVPAGVNITINYSHYFNILNEGVDYDMNTMTGTISFQDAWNPLPFGTTISADYDHYNVVTDVALANGAADDEIIVGGSCVVTNDNTGYTLVEGVNYTVDLIDGTFTFLESPIPGDLITVDYSYYDPADYSVAFANVYDEPYGFAYAQLDKKVPIEGTVNLTKDKIDIFEGADYTIDYETGMIYFTTPLVAGDEVRANYAYSDVGGILYNNNGLFGGYGEDRQSGDWRFYFMNVPDQGLNVNPDDLIQFYINASWNYKPSDVDLFVFGRTSQNQDPGTKEGIPADRFGPYTLVKQTGGSEEDSGFLTVTNTSEELIAPQLNGGLNVVAAHSAILNGSQYGEQLSGQVGWLKLSVDKLETKTNELEGEVSFNLVSNRDFPQGMNVSAVGPASGETKQYEVRQDDLSIIDQLGFYQGLTDGAAPEHHFPIKVESALTLDVRVWPEDESKVPDLDIGICFDANEDGFGSFDEIITVEHCDYVSHNSYGYKPFYASCADFDADEAVTLLNPPDGQYVITVLGYTVKQEPQIFNLEVKAIRAGVEGYLMDGDIGDDVAPQGGTYTVEETIPAFEIQKYTMAWNFPGKSADGEYGGVINIGAGNAPETFTLLANVMLDREIAEIPSVIPSENAILSTGRPTISATIEDVPAGEIDPVSPRMFLDGVEITQLSSINVPLIEDDFAAVQGYPTGTITYVPDGNLEDGGHVVEVIASDLAGNNVSRKWGFTVDKTLPLASLDVDSDTTYTNENSVTLYGITEPDVSLSVRGATASSRVMPDGTFSATVSVSDGETQLAFLVEDISGNSIELRHTVIVDTEAPEFDRVVALNGATTNQRVTGIYGEVSEIGTLLVDDKPVIVNSDGTFRNENLGLVEGQNTIMLEFTDVAGNTAYDFMNITLDTTSPGLKLYGVGDDIAAIIDLFESAGLGDELSEKEMVDALLSSGSECEDILGAPQTFVNDETYNLWGTTEPETTVLVNGKLVDVGSNGNFQSTIRLSPGSNTVVIESKDRAGNSVQDVMTVIFTEASGTNWGAIGIMIILLVVGLILGLFFGDTLGFRSMLGFGAKDDVPPEDADAEELPEDMEELPEDGMPGDEELPEDMEEIPDEDAIPSDAEPIPVEEGMPEELPEEELQDMPEDEIPSEDELPVDEEVPDESEVEDVPEEMEPSESEDTESLESEEPEEITAEEPESEDMESPEPVDDDPRIVKLKEAFESGKISEELYEKNLARFREQ